MLTLYIPLDSLSSGSVVYCSAKVLS